MQVSQLKPGPGSDDSTEGRLPVTSEVGSEGGSYADPTVQVATFRGDVPRVQGHDGAGSHAATHAADDGAMLRYPTESPEDPLRSRAMSFDWRSAAFGLGAGVFLMALLSRARR